MANSVMKCKSDANTIRSRTHHKMARMTYGQKKMAKSLFGAGYYLAAKGVYGEDWRNAFSGTRFERDVDSTFEEQAKLSKSHMDGYDMAVKAAKLADHRFTLMLRLIDDNIDGLRKGVLANDVGFAEANRQADVDAAFSPAYMYAPGEGPVVTSTLTYAPEATVREPMSFRIDVLGDCNAMAASELVAMAKAIMRMPEDTMRAQAASEAGLKVVGPRRVDLRKSRMTLEEFADALGTTPSTVREIARACGDRYGFSKLIKGRMDDIRRAHGLTERDTAMLYQAAVKSIGSLSEAEFAIWKGQSFSSAPSDREIASAIAEHGMLTEQSMVQAGHSRGFYKHLPAEPTRELPPPEPVTKPIENVLVGGNVALAGLLPNVMP